MTTITLQPIAYIESPFIEKFGLPRQPGLITATRAKIRMCDEFARAEAFRDIDQATHLWLTFGFHEHFDHAWRPMVRPPRLGGNAKTGVFATRSSFRPNPIGLSVVRFHALEHRQRGLKLVIDCPDLIHGTPIYDIKPYLPYADAVADAQFALAPEPPLAQLRVVFSDDCIVQLHPLENRYPNLELLIRECLAQDPRPAYQRDDAGREYGIRLYDLNIRWRVIASTVEVLAISSLADR